MEKTIALQFRTFDLQQFFLSQWLCHIVTRLTILLESIYVVHIVDAPMNQTANQKAVWFDQSTSVALHNKL